MIDHNLDASKVDVDVLRKKFNLSREEYLSMDETEFRARFRERMHHSLEIQLYEAISKGKPLKREKMNTLKNLMNIWRERGIPTDKPDYKTAEVLLKLAEASANGEKVDLSVFAPHPVSQEDYQVFDRILKERRSVRHWTDKEVPDELINKVLEAGLWAAHSCNLQSVRYAIIRESTCPGLFLGADIPGGPVHILFLQDERVYKANPFNPERNQLLDIGAAAQNAVLAAHALGLGAVWLTFTNVVKERLEKKLELPEYIKPITYIDLGWPAETPAPPLRLNLDEVVIRRI
jgi:Nitroreductase family.